MPRPIDAALRARIIADIKAGKMNRNEIARTHGVSGSTVTKIAKDERIAFAFDRSKTQNATRARQFDAAAARARMIEDLYADAQRFRGRAWSQYTQVVSGPLGAEFVTTRLPPLRDQQAAYTSLAICMDKAGRLEDRNGDGRIDAARSLLGALFDGLKAEHGDRPDGSG